MTKTLLRCRRCDETTTEPFEHWWARHGDFGQITAAMLWDSFILVRGHDGRERDRDDSESELTEPLFDLA